MKRVDKVLLWDYFLSSYERDLIIKTKDELKQKYPKVAESQFDHDREHLIVNLDLTCTDLFPILTGQSGRK